MVHNTTMTQINLYNSRQVSNNQLKAVKTKQTHMPAQACITANFFDKIPAFPIETLAES